jgi:hypothetical protein
MNIFLAASMRSGSSHLSNTIQRMGWRKASVYLATDDTYNEEPMIDHYGANFVLTQDGQVFHYHMRAIGRNVPILKAYEPKVVVMQRNLLDCVVSWRESCDIDHAAGRGDQYIYAPIYGSQWDTLTDTQKWEWIVYNVVPWYISFYLSWRNADIDYHSIWYEEFFKDQEQGLADMLSAMEVNKVPRRALLAQMCNYQDGKFNVGKVGRGEDLDQGIKDMIKQQCHAWGKDGKELEEKLICRRT